MKQILPLKISPQPTETTCGATCLHALYRYYGHTPSLSKVIREIEHLKGGGTLAVMLGSHALKNGFRARIYTYNLHLFDPTWFVNPAIPLADYIERQAKAKKDRKLRAASRAYIEFLNNGGEILFEDLSVNLLQKYLKKQTPVLTGLSATYLYRSAREVGATNQYNSIKGEPSGHFVVLAGYDKKLKNLLVADPFHLNPFAGSHYYWVDIQRVVSSILLGIVSYDANLLVIEPNAAASRPARSSTSRKTSHPSRSRQSLKTKRSRRTAKSAQTKKL